MTRVMGSAFFGAGANLLVVASIRFVTKDLVGSDCLADLWCHANAGSALLMSPKAVLLVARCGMYISTASLEWGNSSAGQVIEKKALKASQAR